MPISFGRGRKAQVTPYNKVLRAPEGYSSMGSSMPGSGFARSSPRGASRMPDELESIAQHRAAGIDLDNFTTKNRRGKTSRSRRARGIDRSAEFSERFNSPEVQARRAELLGSTPAPATVEKTVAPTKRTGGGKSRSRSGNPAVRAGGGTSRKSKASKPAPLSPRPQVPTMPVMDPMSAPGARAVKSPISASGRRPRFNGGRIPGRLVAGKPTGSAKASAPVAAAAASAGVPTGNAGAGAAVSAALSQETMIDLSPALGKKSRGKRGARATGPVGHQKLGGLDIDDLSAPTTRVEAAAAAAAGAPAGNAAPTTGAAVTAAVNNAPPTGSAGGAATGSRTINRSLNTAGKPSGMKRAGGAVRSALNMATETKGRRAALAVGAGVIGLGALLNGREKRGTSSGARSMYSY